jgi:hypothetical protein
VQASASSQNQQVIIHASSSNTMHQVFIKILLQNRLHLHIYDSCFHLVDTCMFQVVNATQSSIHDNKIYKFITETPKNKTLKTNKKRQTAASSE